MSPTGRRPRALGAVLLATVIGFGPVSGCGAGRPAAQGGPAVIALRVAGRAVTVRVGDHHVRVCLQEPERCVGVSRTDLRRGGADAVAARLDHRPSLLLAVLPSGHRLLGGRWASVVVPPVGLQVAVGAVATRATGVCVAYRRVGGGVGHLGVLRTAAAGVGLPPRRSPCERARDRAVREGDHEPRDQHQPRDLHGRRELRVLLRRRVRTR